MRRLFILGLAVAAGGVFKLFQPRHQRLMTARQIGMRLPEPQQFAAHLFKRQCLMRQQFLEALKPCIRVLRQIAIYIL